MREMPHFDLGDFVDAFGAYLLDNPAALLLSGAILFLVAAVVLNEGRLRRKAESMERAAYRMRRTASAAQARQELEQRARALRIVADRERGKGEQ